MKDLGYYNGAYGELDKMSVPMLDRGAYFGDGVYDVTYSRNHKIYALDEHINRFFKSASMLEINIPHTKEEFREILAEMVKKVDDGEQLVYMQATRGTGYRDHFYEDGGKANIWIMLRPKKVKDTYKKMSVITLPDKRFLYCNIKTLNLIPSVLYTKEAVRAGADESILHRDGIVTECAHSNISILKNGVLRTAPIDQYVLPGTARAHLIKMCQRFGIPVDERAFTLDELFGADEVILTSASAFCVAIESIDKKSVGGRSPRLLKKLQDALLEDFLKETD